MQIFVRREYSMNKQYDQRIIIGMVLEYEVIGRDKVGESFVREIGCCVKEFGFLYIIGN